MARVASFRLKDPSKNPSCTFWEFPRVNGVDYFEREIGMDWNDDVWWRRVSENRRDHVNAINNFLLDQYEKDWIAMLERAALRETVYTKNNGLGKSITFQKIGRA